MGLETPQVKRLILDLLKSPSDRDKQRKVGASNLSDPCDWCLGHAMAHGGSSKNGANRWWMGARIGTAIHGALEQEEAKHVDRPMSYHYEALEGAIIEQKIELGYIEGYGKINSSPDLVLPKYNHLLDHKTTTREKLKKYKLDGPPKRYLYQTMLYAWGLNKAGIKIDTVSLVFICRDGSTDDDIWVYTLDYNEALAVAAWGRAELLWKFIDGPDREARLEMLTSDEDCFVCSFEGRV